VSAGHHECTNLERRRCVTFFFCLFTLSRNAEFRAL
jgi:hypothetical protein